MRRSDFGSALGFAGIAAAGYAVFAVALGTWGAPGTMLGLYAPLAVAAYLARLRAPLPRRLGVALAVALAGLGVALVGLPPAWCVLAAAAMLALARGGILGARRGARAWVLEAALAVGGLGLARWLLAGSLLSAVLAVWGFFLVQSVHALVGGLAPPAGRQGLDPFEQARGRLEALLEKGPAA